MVQVSHASQTTTTTLYWLHAGLHVNSGKQRNPACMCVALASHHYCQRILGHDGGGVGLRVDGAAAVADTPVVHDAHNHTLLWPSHTLQQGVLQGRRYNMAHNTNSDKHRNTPCT